MFRVIVSEIAVGAREQSRPLYQELTYEQSVLIGRNGDLGLGASLSDEGVSRRALAIIPTAEGWKISCTNRRQAVLHLWGQRSRWLKDGEQVVARWPRVGIRVVGQQATYEHWLLLEADPFVVFPALEPVAEPKGQLDQSNAPGLTTTTGTAPPGLTAAQLQAVTAIFGQHLAWPPVSAPQPKPLDGVANRLGVTAGAVKERLKAVQAKAAALGAPRQAGVTDPDYIYVLAAHGYLTAPSIRIDADPYR